MFHSLFGKAHLVATIRRAGFNVGTPATQAPKGFPMRWPSVIMLVVLWNLLFLLEMPNSETGVWMPGPYVVFGLVGLFGLATFLPKSDRLQSWFMREDRDVSEISSLLKLLQLVTGLMLVAFGFNYIAR